MKRSQVGEVVGDQQDGQATNHGPCYHRLVPLTGDCVAFHDLGAAFKLNPTSMVKQFLRVENILLTQRIACATPDRQTSNENERRAVVRDCETHGGTERCTQE
ncbi:hypothetical protein Tco_0765859 [Tanacetum coccineum]